MCLENRLIRFLLMTRLHSVQQYLSVATSLPYINSIIIFVRCILICVSRTRLEGRFIFLLLLQVRMCPMYIYYNCLYIDSKTYDDAQQWWWLFTGRTQHIEKIRGTVNMNKLHIIISCIRLHKVLCFYNTIAFKLKYGHVSKAPSNIAKKGKVS